MGRVAKFSEQQIIDAGLSIVRDGGIVSAFAIRNLIGGGSSRRINDVWIKHQDSATKAEEFISDSKLLPPDLNSLIQSYNHDFETKLITFATRAYKAAVEHSINKENILSKQLEKQKHILESTQKSAIEALEVADQKAESLERKIIELQSNLTGKSETLNKIMGANRVLENRIKQLEKREIELLDVDKKLAIANSQIELFKSQIAEKD